MNKTIITNGQVSVDGVLQQADIEITGNKISNIATNINCSGAKVIDARNMLVLPGIIETHTHGGNNFDMNSVTQDTLNELSKFYASHGVTSFLATLLTDSKEKLRECLKLLGDCVTAHQPGAKLIGIHMEGPYLSEQYKGAMPAELLQPASIDEFTEYQELANGNVRMMTLSPEADGVLSFIEHVAKTGVVLSMGHTGAEYNLSMQAINKGVSCSTHTMNAMRLIHQHEPAALGAVLVSDIYAEIICDGLHLHPGNIKMMLKAKGWDKVLAVTDSISAAGLPDGSGYKLGVHDIVVQNGDAWLADGSSRAGSTLTSNEGFRNLIKFTGARPEKVIELMSKNQAIMLGINQNKGSISTGKDADITIWDNEYNLLCTIVNGNVVYKKGEAN